MATSATPAAVSPDQAVPAVSAQTLTSIALAGNPNCGKTTLFNALTGLRQKVANYPGITVEKKSGRCHLGDGHHGRAVEIIDLPGTYSLIPNSPDEAVATQVLRGTRSDTPRPDVIIAVVDASNLARNLYLVSHLLELGSPVVVALNMTDIAQRRGQAVDAAALQGLLGVPVIALVGHKRSGVDHLRAALLTAVSTPAPGYPVPDGLVHEMATMTGIIARSGMMPTLTTAQSSAMARRLLIGDHIGLETVAGHALIAGALVEAHQRLTRNGSDAIQLDIEARYRWIDHLVTACVTSAAREPAQTATERLDRVLVHPLWGLIIFAGIMAMLFISIFTLAKPIMDFLQNGITWLGNVCTHPMPEGALRSLITDGVFNGVGTVVVFVPQIALLFLFLAVLEDSGYLARAAFLMDRLLSRIGLHGKSFIPLLSSFACAIPGVMAARTIDSPNERLATILVAPFMSCSARLPVYALLIGAFFSGFGRYNSLVKGGIMLGCYALGVLAAVVTAWACKLLLGRKAVAPFILELPSYKLPQWDEVLRQMWTNTSKFLTKAGTVIFFLSILLWALAYYPRLSDAAIQQVRAQVHDQLQADVATNARHPASANHATDTSLGLSSAPSGSAAEDATVRQKQDNAVAGAQLAHSYAGTLGHIIEPIIKPLGFDWKIGVGLVASFAAREVFVSTMGIVYSEGEGDENDEAKTSLHQAMVGDRYADGRPVWTPVVAASLLVWFVLAMQCMSTFAVVRRETNTWRWPIFQLAYMNAVAFVGSLITYQLGILFIH